MSLSGTLALLLTLGSNPSAPAAPAAKKGTDLSKFMEPKPGPTSLGWPTDEEYKGEPPDPDPFGFSTYNDRRTEFMDVSYVNGARFAMAHLIVNDPPMAVLQTYRAQFAKAGIKPIEGSPAEAPGMHYLSFRPNGSRQLKTLALLPYGRGTMILASIGDPRPMFHPGEGPDADFPKPPGATQMVRSTIGDVASGQRQATFLVRGLTPSAVTQFYADTLPKQGYSELKTADGKGSQTPGSLMFRKGSDKVTVNATAAENVGDTQVTVLWISEE